MRLVSIPTRVGSGELGSSAMTDTTTLAQAQFGTERDDDEPGGPAHPAPGHMPPEPEPSPGPERDDDEPGGPAHPGPGHEPPASRDDREQRVGD
jgi:hypothetical protein